MTTLTVKSPISTLWEFYGHDGTAYVVTRVPVSQSITVPAGSYSQVVMSSLNAQGLEVRGHYIGDLTLREGNYNFNAASNALTPVSKPPIALPGVNWTILILLGLLLASSGGRRKA